MPMMGEKRHIDVSMYRRKLHLDNNRTHLGLCLHGNGDRKQVPLRCWCQTSTSRVFCPMMRLLEKMAASKLETMLGLPMIS